MLHPLGSLLVSLAHSDLSLRGVPLMPDPMALSPIWMAWAVLYPQLLVGLKALGKAVGVSASARQCPFAQWAPHKQSEDEQSNFKQDFQTSWSGRNAVPGPDDITDFLTLQLMPRKLTREM